MKLFYSCLPQLFVCNYNRSGRMCVLVMCNISNTNTIITSNITQKLYTTVLFLKPYTPYIFCYLNQQLMEQEKHSIFILLHYKMVNDRLTIINDSWHTG